MQKLAEISDGDHFWARSGVAPHERLSLCCREELSSNRGEWANIKQQQNAADKIAQHQYPQTPMFLKSKTDPDCILYTYIVTEGVGFGIEIPSVLFRPCYQNVCSHL